MLANAYSETFDRFVARLPELEGIQRRVQFESFAASGFPDKSLEDWHYTDLTSLSEHSYRLADGDEMQLTAQLLEDAETLIYFNGDLHKIYSSGKRWHGSFLARVTTDDGIPALNAAFATGGLNLVLKSREKLDKPLHVLFQSESEGAETMSHQRHRIELGANTEATVLLHFAGRGNARLSTHVVDVSLAAGARLKLFRLYEEGGGASVVTQIDVRQARDSHLLALSVDLGGGLARHDFNVDLAENGAEAEVSGLYVPRSGAHVDNHTRVTHTAPHCRSRSHYRGIIDEHAKAVFNGKVIVKPGAQKTDSEQRIANLLLSRKAEVNAKPELEIYADDVKCAHGSTVGQLDETALAYLRSRGIPRDTARALLLRAFATQILDRIEWPALRILVETLLHLPTEMPEVIDA